MSDPFKPGNLPVRLLRRVDRWGLEYRYQWSSLSYARNTHRAHRIAKGHPGFNACLMYGTTYRPRLDVPTYCYFDATVAQVRRAAGWGFARLSDAQAASAERFQGRVFDGCTAIFPRTRWAAQSVLEDCGMVLGEFVGGVRLGPVSKLLRRWVTALPVSAQPHRADWVAGASMIVRTPVIEQIGLLDEAHSLLRRGRFSPPCAASALGSPRCDGSPLRTRRLP